MISQRLAKAFTKFAWIDEHYDPICSIPLTKALARVVEALERQSHPHIESACKDRAREALKELERALKECGV